MYSMRYGTVPVVHAVGGLADTVRDYAPATGKGGARREKPTGFVFREYSPAALLEALMRAFALFPERTKVARASGGRDAAGFFMGPFRARVRQNI